MAGVDRPGVDPAPDDVAEPVRLTSLSPSAGCAAKIGMRRLDDEIVAQARRMAEASAAGPEVDPSAPAPTFLPTGVSGIVPVVTRSATRRGRPHDDTVVGVGDDAAVVRIGREQVVATVDFFPPIVDDAHAWGHVAATNAIGDVHAMGARPTVALMVLGWPDDVAGDLLADVVAGVHHGAQLEGIRVAGGHSITAPVPFVGLSVVGALDGTPLCQDELQVDDRLVLTAPLGTGIATTACKRAPREASRPGGRLHDVLAAAVDVMTTSNGPVVHAARDHGVRAATDVTGFGLLGHLYRMARASQVDVTVAAAQVPVLPGVVDLARDGLVPGGSRGNADVVVERAGVATDPVTLAVLADAQTSGGLLLGVAAGGARDLVARLRDLDHAAAVVGRVTDSGHGRITVDGPLDT